MPLTTDMGMFRNTDSKPTLKRMHACVMNPVSRFSVTLAIFMSPLCSCWGILYDRGRGTYTWFRPSLGSMYAGATTADTVGDVTPDGVPPPGTPGILTILRAAEPAAMAGGEEAGAEATDDVPVAEGEGMGAGGSSEREGGGGGGGGEASCEADADDDWVPSVGPEAALLPPVVVVLVIVVVVLPFGAPGGVSVGGTSVLVGSLLVSSLSAGFSPLGTYVAIARTWARLCTVAAHIHGRPRMESTPVTAPRANRS
mmetsp:Transcript_25293/g.73032  ORF Transcript_25293/g.73032 Transcript_25293/m.73032 type:complete len:255 (-) Transcript_25293:984-1748(-)